MLSEQERREIEQGRLILARGVKAWWIFIKWLAIISAVFWTAAIVIMMIVSPYIDGGNTDRRVSSCQYEKRTSNYDRSRKQTAGWYVCLNSFKGNAHFDMTNEANVQELKKLYFGPPLKIELEEPILSLKNPKWNPEYHP